MMVDIHHHLLPGLDDGPSDIEVSLTMAQLAVADGITHVVCTPHANASFPYDRNVNEGKRAALARRLSEEGIPLTLGLGCDFHLSYENVQDALRNPRQYTINETRYLLIELPDFGIPPNIGETFYDLQRAGFHLILTHPERNPTLAEDPRRMVPWVRDGVLVQVTADSVTGRRGKAVQRITQDLLRKHWVHFVASDAHNTASRPPRMQEARVWIERKYGADYAQMLCGSNPAAVFAGRPLGPQRSPLGLEDDADGTNWFGRLIGRP